MIFQIDDKQELKYAVWLCDVLLSADQCHRLHLIELFEEMGCYFCTAIVAMCAYYVSFFNFCNMQCLTGYNWSSLPVSVPLFPLSPSNFPRPSTDALSPLI